MPPSAVRRFPFSRGAALDLPSVRGGVIASRLEAGEPTQDPAGDYRAEVADIDEAIRYRLAAESATY